MRFLSHGAVRRKFLFPAPAVRDEEVIADNYRRAGHSRQSIRRTGESASVPTLNQVGRRPQKHRHWCSLIFNIQLRAAGMYSNAPNVATGAAGRGWRCAEKSNGRALPPCRWLHRKPCPVQCRLPASKAFGSVVPRVLQRAEQEQALASPMPLHILQAVQVAWFAVHTDGLTFVSRCASRLTACLCVAARADTHPLHATLPVAPNRLSISCWPFRVVFIHRLLKKFPACRLSERNGLLLDQSAQAAEMNAWQCRQFRQ